MARKPLLPPPAIHLGVESILLTCPADAVDDLDALWDGVRAVGSPEHQALWSENGLRIGQLGSPLPSRLQDRLHDEAPGRPNGCLKTFHHRQEAFLPTTEVLDRCRVRLCMDLAAPPNQRQWEQVIGGLWLHPRLHKRGVVLTCEPRLQHAERNSWIRPAPDDSRFLRSEEPRWERFPFLQLETELTTDDYLLIGPASGMPESLGMALFGPGPAAATPSSASQYRLLLLRIRMPALPAQDLPEIPPPYLRR
ncbi:MAG: hypothetical protein NZ703_13460 [Gemmataceae bacterium]|nr:hypothetical protein [Gemmataceae bacterium]MCS7272083.1 hypothetical protein [Gemmataceae bacterium]